MKTVTLDNNIYDKNKVFNKESDVIFEGNFEEITKFVLDNFHITLPTGLAIKEYEDFKKKLDEEEFENDFDKSLIKMLIGEFGENGINE